jgi:hypothetical protein
LIDFAVTTTGDTGPLLADVPTTNNMKQASSI